MCENHSAWKNEPVSVIRTNECRNFDPYTEKCDLNGAHCDTLGKELREDSDFDGEPD